MISTEHEEYYKKCSLQLPNRKTSPVTSASLVGSYYWLLLANEQLISFRDISGPNKQQMKRLCFLVASVFDKLQTRKMRARRLKCKPHLPGASSAVEDERRHETNTCKVRLRARSREETHASVD